MRILNTGTDVEAAVADALVRKEVERTHVVVLLIKKSNEGFVDVVGARAVLQ